MISMQHHGISEAEWLRFVDDTLEPERQRSIQAHLRICTDCANLASELTAWRESLIEEGERLREACRLSDEAMDSLLERSLARIRSAEPEYLRSGSGWTVAEGITVLRFLIEPICGPGMARTTIDLAVRRSADEGSRVTRRNWRLFVGNLSDATALICGLAAGRLVDRAGLCLVIEER